jgi:hypothetical protein
MKWGFCERVAARDFLCENEMVVAFPDAAHNLGVNVGVAA